MKKILLLLLLLATPVHAQVSVVSAADTSDEDAVDTATITVSGSGALGITCAGGRDWGASPTTVSSVTWNGSGMTEIVPLTTAEGVGITCYRIFSPSGTSVVWTMSNNGLQFFHACAIIFNGTHATTPDGTEVFNNDPFSEALSATVSSETNGMVMTFYYARSTVAASLAPDAGQTEQTEEQSTNHTSACSTEPGAASVTSGYTWSGSIQSHLVVIPLAPAAGGGPVTCTGKGSLMLMGAGKC